MPLSESKIDWCIRPTAQGDRAALLSITRDLIRDADTYAFDPDISDAALWDYWVPKDDKGAGYVIARGDDIGGLFVIKQNQPGPGAHVANASFAVSKAHRGHGLGRKMGEAALHLAPTLGFKQMQFNIVLASNIAALHLWRSLGFEDIGRIPKGFCRPDGSYDDFFIMHRFLDPADES